MRRGPSSSPDSTGRRDRWRARETHFSAGRHRVFAALSRAPLLGWAPERIVNVAWASTGRRSACDGRACDQRGPANARGRHTPAGPPCLHGLRLAIAWRWMSVLSTKAGHREEHGRGRGHNAAIYGQLGGAYCGVEAIPASCACGEQNRRAGSRAGGSTSTCRAPAACTQDWHSCVLATDEAGSKPRPRGSSCRKSMALARRRGSHRSRPRCSSSSPWPQPRRLDDDVVEPVPASERRVPP